MSFQRLLVLSLAALLACVSAPARAADPFGPSDEEDRVAIEALALYPEDIRDHILEASTEADLLQDVESLQERSQRSFRDLLEPYPQDDQQDLFDLSRYPDLVGAIAEGGPKDRGALERIAARYPEDVRASVLRQGGPRYRVIVRMNALLDEFDDRFDDLVADLPPRKAEAFRALLGAPEVLSLLTEHGELTVLLGDTYERDPQGARERFADLNLEVARRNADEAKDWKESVDTDPDLRRDYENAARDYEADTGYAAYAPPRTTVSVVVNPYPFWVGYPWWYPVSYNYYDPWYWWYPRRSWGHVGWGFGPRFYAGFGGGLGWAPWYPTPFFSSWYFSSGHHHGRYPYLSDHYVDYYWDHDDHHDRYDHQDRHDRHGGDVHIENHYNFNKRVVKKFVYESDRVVSRDFLRGSREERVKRFREYGKLAPELEKVQHEARRKELGKHGRADRLRVPDRVRDADRAGTQKAGGEILRKREKDAPDLARLSRERGPGDDAAEARRGKSGREAGPEKQGPSDAAKGEPRGRDRDAASVAPRDDKTKDGDKSRAVERGKAQGGVGRDAPSVTPSESGGKRDRGEAGKKGTARSAEPDSDRVSPTVERPVDGGGRGNGGKSGDSARKGTTRERDATPDVPTRDGGKSGARSTTPKTERRDAPKVEREPQARSSAPKVEREPRREQPRYEPQPEPRVEREPSRGKGGGGGDGYQAQRPQPGPSSGERQGGGDGKGKSTSKKEQDEEEQNGGGGGGRKR